MTQNGVIFGMFHVIFVFRFFSHVAKNCSCLSNCCHYSGLNDIKPHLTNRRQHMQIIRNLISRVTTVWTLYSVITQINRALKSYPGTGDEIRLRAWLLDHLALLAGMAAKTATPVDDTVIYYSLRIIENNTAWKIFFNILTITGNLSYSISETTSGNMANGISVTDEAQPDCILALYEIDKSLNLDAAVGAKVNRETRVENPILVVSAVGLLLQIIQFLRKR